MSKFDVTRVDEAAKEAQRRLIHGGMSVSLWNVSQATVGLLGAPSWRALGYEYQQIPTLSRIQNIEAKVNAFIECFSSARLMATVHDLHIEICKEFSALKFGDLGLGNLVRHPLVKKYFNIAPHANEICMMTTEELVFQLSMFMSTLRNNEMAEKAFRGFLERYRVGEEYVGIQIHSLKTYITYLNEARGAEHAVIRSIKESERKKLKDNTPLESFRQASYSDQNVVISDMEIIGLTLVMHEEKEVKIIHTDPFRIQRVQASDTEVRVFVAKLKSTCNRDFQGEVFALMMKEPIPRKWMGEKFFLFQSNPSLGLLGVTVKAVRSGFMDYVLEGTNSQLALSMINAIDEYHLDDDEREFVSTWKEVCLKYPTYEVFALMLEYYGKYGEDKLRLQHFFCALSRGRCLLHVAVQVMKTVALVDRLREGLSTGDNSTIPMSPCAFGGDKTTKTGGDVYSIIRKIAFYFGLDQPTGSNKDFPKGKRLVLHGCEAWLRRELSVTDFSNLGFGGFTEFIKNHASLLPREIKHFMIDAIAIGQNYLEVSMQDQQIQVMVDQAKRSLGGRHSHLDENYVSMILRNQFPSINFTVVSTEKKNENKTISIDAPNPQTSSISPYSVLFSSTLVITTQDAELASNMCHHSIGSLRTTSTKEAKECLLKAPFLVDLLTWSDWDRAFAPSLGPLVHWLLHEGYIEGLSCIVTRNGRVIKVDNCSSNEDLSKAFLEGSPTKVALQIMSLFWRYGGCHDAPKKLLEHYIKSSIDTRINKNGETIGYISKFFLDCLVCLPLEFRDFTAELFIPVLRTINKDAHAVMLSQCNELEKRVMLHDLGLYLGIVEWIDCFEGFNVNDLDSRLDNYVSLPIKEKAYEQVIDHTFDDCVCLDMAEEEKIIHGNNIIESIRRKEFGMEEGVSSVNSELLKKQHTRLGRALHFLSTELYSHDSHFILEMVQNADDNSYLEGVEPTLVFILQSDGIIILNNEKGFSENNIKALCDIGRSTKKANGLNSGYIGKKGIGFKSVFRVTSAPEVHSNGFHVKFDKSEDDIGFILPTIIPPRDIKYIHKNLLCDVEYQANLTTWGTCIVLPFKPNNKCHESDMTYVLSMFSELHPSLLLFLNRLKCIKLKNRLDGNLIIMRKEISDDGTVLISQANQETNWLVVNQDLDASQIRSDVGTTRISLAFSLQKTVDGDYEPNLQKQSVFAFLPLRKYGLNFILQADFSLPSSREEVDHDSAWNQWLLTKFPDLFVIALKSFCQLSCFKEKIGKAITAFMKFIPLIGEVYGFFSLLPNFILSKLQASDCLLLEGSILRWVRPCKVVRGWNDEVRNFLSDTLLEKYLKLGYLNKEVILSDSLAQGLGVQEYGTDLLVKILRSVCREKDGIKKLGLKWVSSWINSFHISLAKVSNEIIVSNLLNTLREIPFVPLLDGSYVSFIEGHIWLPSDHSYSRYGDKCSTEQFPSIYSNLRVSTPFIFSNEEGRVDNILELLTKLGIKQLFPHDVIKNYILVSKLDEETMISKKDLVIEFLIFVLDHFQMPCTQCSIEKGEIISELCKKKIILTNHGFMSPNEQSIHFGEAYGCTIEVERLIGNTDIIWHEVDSCYLNPTNSKLPLYGTTKWREIFKDLGVNDFVQVTEVKKKTSDKLIAIDYESPELNILLSKISSSKDPDKSKYLMKLLDDYWDECFSSKSNDIIPFKCHGEPINLIPTFMKEIYHSKWVASSKDDGLHCPSELFYECEAVFSILGSNSPYAIPKITNRDLVKILGLKDNVKMVDILRVIDNWRKSDSHKASISQMYKLYFRAWDEISSSTEEASNLHIFVPSYIASDQTEIVPGLFLSPHELYWHDPTGCFDLIRLKSSSCEQQNSEIRTISTIYPDLHDFFVNYCGVRETPPFEKYFAILLRLSSVASAKESAHKVFQVLMKWAEDLARKINLEQLHELKNKLTTQENTVLPTVHNKWVSLHASFGLVCWSDNNDLIEEISQFHHVQFLQFGELSDSEKEDLSGKVADLLRDVGIQPLSEVLYREVIFGKELEELEKAKMVNWILPYAQRYVCKKHPDIYNLLQESESEKINQFKVVVVEEISYKNTIKANHINSQSVSICNSLLQGSNLYTTPEANFLSILIELSCLLFHGTPNNEMVNFLSTLVFMLEAGVKEHQLESYITQNQQLPQLPKGEIIWSLQSLTTPTIKEQPTRISTVRAPVSEPALSMRIEPLKPKTKHTNKVSTSSNVIRLENIVPIEVANVPFHNEKQILFVETRDESVLHMIGKEGERLAYVYFREKFKYARVTWVNESKESLNPYDILVEKINGEVEYIEVKATTCETKDWFEISPNEWRFAIEKRELFSIAWVVLSNQTNPMISVFKDPLKLCDARFLQLAMHVRKEGEPI